MNSTIIKHYIVLFKLRLSLLVAFSAGFGYSLAIGWHGFVGSMLCLGGLLVSSAASAFNQIIEQKHDQKMTRTKNRPLPTKNLTTKKAGIAAGIVGLVGLFLLWWQINGLTALLSFCSMVLYCCVYTPLKRQGPIAVLAGAFPGALPPLIGWVAATGKIDVVALTLFGIQFIWQFPHFWSIAWVAANDYHKAGFQLLPMHSKKSNATAIQIMLYTLLLLPCGLLPAQLGITGIGSAVVAMCCGLFFLSQTIWLVKTRTNKAALKTMFTSFIYLPIVQIAFLLDKI